MLYIKTKKLTKKSRTYAACRGFFLYSTVKHPGVDQNMQKVVKGLVLLAAVIFDVVSKRKAFIVK